MIKIPCSLPILTLNAKTSLERLLPVVVPFIEDVYIMDGNSTDGTVECAESFGVRVERQFDTDASNQRIENFADMRFRLWSKAKFRWLFILDADELPGPGLLDRVREIVATNDVMKVHSFERKACLPNGDVVTHAFMYPDLYIRVFNLDSGITLAKRAMHERFILPDTVREQVHQESVLSGWPLVSEMRSKINRYIPRDLEGFHGSSVWRIVRWGVVYNFKSFLGQAWRAIRAWIFYVWTGGILLPWPYTRLMLMYRLRMMLGCMRLLIL